MRLTRDGVQTPRCASTMTATVFPWPTEDHLEFGSPKAGSARNGARRVALSSHLVTGQSADKPHLRSRGILNVPDRSPENGFTVSFWPTGRPARSAMSPRCGLLRGHRPKVGPAWGRYSMRAVPTWLASRNRARVDSGPRTRWPSPGAHYPVACCEAPAWCGQSHNHAWPGKMTGPRLGVTAPPVHTCPGPKFRYEPRDRNVPSRRRGRRGG